MTALFVVGIEGSVERIARIMSGLNGARTFVLLSMLVVIVATLSASTVVLMNSCCPMWREYHIQTALAVGSAPPHWWPVEWRAEYLRRLRDQRFEQLLDAVDKLVIDPDEPRVTVGFGTPGWHPKPALRRPNGR